MIASERVLKGSTTRLVASFVDGAGAALTGLTPSVRIFDRTANQYLKVDGTWVSPAPAGSEPVMTATDATDLPGVYHFDFALRTTLTAYDARVDGGATAANRIQEAEIIAVDSDEAELHVAFAMLANKRSHTISTGVDQVMDNDQTTLLRTMTPTDGGSDLIVVVPS